jgi:hypothetical protein
MRRGVEGALDRNQADLLLADLGKQVGIDGLALDEGGACRLSFNDGTVVVDIAFDEEAGVVGLESSLGVAPTPDRLKRALAANFCWLEVGGAIFGVDRLANRLVLRRRCLVADLDLASLTTALRGLVAQTQAWTKLLGELEPRERPGAAAADRQPLAAAMRA